MRNHSAGELNLKTIEKSRKLILTVLISLFLVTSCCFKPIALIDNDTHQIFPNANSSWFWSNYEVVSETSTGNAYIPKIAIDSEDNIHVVWYDNTADLLSSGSDADIFYKSFNSATETWTSLELVSSESTAASYNPVIAVDTENNVHVAWADYTDYLGSDIDRDVFYKKKNAGGSWTITSVISTDSTLTVHEDVDICADLNNNVYISWSDPTDILGADTDNDIFIKYFNNTASTWAPITLISTESIASAYKPQFVADSLTGDIHFVWYDYTDILSADTDGDIFYRKWNVFDSSLSDLELVNSFSTLNAYDPQIALDSDNNIHVVWGDYTDYLDSGINLDLFYRKLLTSSNSWGHVEVVSSESRFNTNHPDLIVDDNGCIFVAWYDPTEYGGAGPDQDVFFKYKDPNSNQWSMTDVVTVESNDLSHVPEMALDSQGFVSCVWTEEDNLGSAGLDPDIFYRKFAGTPSIPVLSPILPNPSSIGNISLHWNKIHSAEEYSIYRDTSFFWSISGMEPLTTTTDTSFTNTVNDTGVYYYAILASNEYGSGGISNVEDVEIIEKPRLFASLSLTEILIMAGAILGLQIIVAVLTYSLARSGISKGTSSKRKK